MLGAAGNLGATSIKKLCLFRSSKATLEARSVLLDPVAEARSLEEFNMQLQGPICGYRSQDVAAGAKILLQEP